METRTIIRVSAKPDCHISFKGKDHKGLIIETRMDKIKVKILNAIGEVIKTDWFDKREVKRIW